MEYTKMAVAALAAVGIILAMATDRKYGSYGAGFAALAILVSFLLHLFSEVM